MGCGLQDDGAAGPMPTAKRLEEGLRGIHLYYLWR